MSVSAGTLPRRLLSFDRGAKRELCCIPTAAVGLARQHLTGESMDTFSDDLRRERERAGVSLDTIAEITRISPRHLEALEAGRFGELPGGVFRHGILRSYLSVLGVDSAPWIERFDGDLRQTGQGEPEAAGIEEFAVNIQRSRPEPTRPHHDLRWFGVVVMLCLLAALGWSVWRFVLHGHVIVADSSAAAFLAPAAL